LAGQIGQLMEELERRLPDTELVPSHGGYRRSQLLDADGELGVIDFDGFCRSPAARDRASFAASFVETPDDVPVAFETLDVLTEAYGRRPAGLTWYLATYLLRRTRRPFTRLEADWPDAVEERLLAAERALELEL
jgi:thiamine kinase-like enzyme